MIRDLLTGFVQEDFIEEIDFAQMEKLGAIYILEEYQKRETDLILKLNLKGQEAGLTNMQYFFGRLKYDLRMPQLDIVDYCEKEGIQEFTEKEFDTVDKIISGPPKYWRRTTWRGWLADGVRAKNLKPFGIKIKTKKEKQEEKSLEIHTCPLHGTDLQKTMGDFGPLQQHIYDMKPGDIILSIRHKQDREYYIVLDDLSIYGDTITLEALEIMGKIEKRRSEG